MEVSIGNLFFLCGCETPVLAARTLFSSIIFSSLSFVRSPSPIIVCCNSIQPGWEGGGGGGDSRPFRPFHHLLVNSVKILVNENLAKRSNLFRTFHDLLVNSVKKLVNESLAKRSSLFRPFHNLLV